jgi:nicotinamide mononucleotide transporter
VPLLLKAGYYPSAMLYAAYGVFCVVGFLAWRRVQRAEAVPPDRVEVAT